jgi:hypothetical protein
MWLSADGVCDVCAVGCQLVRYFKNIGITCPARHNPADFFVQQIAVGPRHATPT